MVQAIVYSVATGRVRRVVDPQANVPNILAFLASVAAKAGEATLVYTKQGAGADTLPAWQTTVNAHTLLDPDVLKADWYCGVDALNAIKWSGVCDPLCGDRVAGLTLIKAPWGADSLWTYNGITFTAPPVVSVKAVGG